MGSTTRPDICVIVPTIRDFGTMRTYFANARRHKFPLQRLHVLFITEDFCDKGAMQRLLEEEGVSGEVYNAKDRQKWFEERGLSSYADLVPRRSHAETSFGLLVMQAHPMFRYGIFIDDDTAAVEQDDYFGDHLRNLEHAGEVDEVGSDKHWVNVLHQRFSRHGLYPRGYPYSAMRETTRIAPRLARQVVCSQGLWTNVPDLDAVRILMDGNLQGQAETRTNPQDFPSNFVVESGACLTVCSMNLAFRREIIPVFYQLPMDDNPWKLGRFDDIWSGIFLKRACDILGADIITGRPLCVHNKAPRSTFKDLNAEVPALEINENLWRWINDSQVAGTDWASIALSIADRLEHVKEPVAYADFVPYMARFIRRWVECCEALQG